MGDIAELETRVTALEKAQRENKGTLEWISQTLGTIAGVQASHTHRLDRIEMEVGQLKLEVRALKADITGLRHDLPGIVSDVMREVLREQKL